MSRGPTTYISWMGSVDCQRMRVMNPGAEAAIGDIDAIVRPRAVRCDNESLTAGLDQPRCHRMVWNRTG